MSLSHPRTEGERPNGATRDLSRVRGGVRGPESLHLVARPRYVVSVSGGTDYWSPCTCAACLVPGLNIPQCTPAVGPGDRCGGRETRQPPRWRGWPSLRGVVAALGFLRMVGGRELSPFFLLFLVSAPLLGGDEVPVSLARCGSLHTSWCSFPGNAGLTGRFAFVLQDVWGLRMSPTRNE